MSQLNPTGECVLRDDASRLPRMTNICTWQQQLEHDSGRRNRKRGFPEAEFSDSRCWLGLGASIDGKTLFTGSSGSGGRLGFGGPHVPGDGGAVWRQRCQRGEVVAAVPGDRERGGL